MIFPILLNCMRDMVGTTIVTDLEERSRARSNA